MSLLQQHKFVTPDNYASAKVAYLHPLKRQNRKNPYIQHDRPLSRNFITQARGNA